MMDKLTNWMTKSAEQYLREKKSANRKETIQEVFNSQFDDSEFRKLKEGLKNEFKVSCK